MFSLLHFICPFKLAQNIVILIVPQRCIPEPCTDKLLVPLELKVKLTVSVLKVPRTPVVVRLTSLSSLCNVRQCSFGRFWWWEQHGQMSVRAVIWFKHRTIQSTITSRDFLSFFYIAIVFFPLLFLSFFLFFPKAHWITKILPYVLFSSIFWRGTVYEINVCHKWYMKYPKFEFIEIRFVCHVKS